MVAAELARQKLSATLLVSMSAAWAEAWAYTPPTGHEVAGLGLPLQVAWLEASSRQPVRLWALRDSDISRQRLAQLAAQGLALLPPSTPRPEPGGFLRLGAGQLGQLERWRLGGYQFVPISQLPGLRRATPRDLVLWAYTTLIDERFDAQHGVVSLAERPDAVLRVARTVAAPPLPLPAGTPVLELHVQSRRLNGLATQNPLMAYRAAHRSLKDAAQLLQTPEWADCQAVFANTLFYSLMGKLGFQLQPLPRRQAQWYRLGFELIRRIYGLNANSSEKDVKLAWMTRQDFLRRFGK